jgi:hypothetical protein
MEADPKQAQFFSLLGLSAATYIRYRYQKIFYGCHWRLGQLRFGDQHDFLARGHAAKARAMRTDARHQKSTKPITAPPSSLWRQQVSVGGVSRLT